MRGVAFRNIILSMRKETPHTIQEGMEIAYSVRDWAEYDAHDTIRRIGDLEFEITIPRVPLFHATANPSTGTITLSIVPPFSSPRRRVLGSNGTDGREE